MLHGMGLREVLTMGGGTLLVLLFGSVVCWTMVIQRVLSFLMLERHKRQPLMDQVGAAVRAGNTDLAGELCRACPAPFARVMLAGLRSRSEGAMSRRIREEVAGLERFTTVIATIGSVSVYIGLFGTVLGIMQSFQGISTAGPDGMRVAMLGIAESLICTATGLLVAVPAVIAYNFIVRWIDRFVRDMELAASEMSELLDGGERA